MTSAEPSTLVRGQPKRDSIDASRSDVLFITPCLPNANGTGLERRAWGHLTGLAAHANVSLLILMPPEPVADLGDRLDAVRALTGRAAALPMAPSSGRGQGDSAPVVLFNALLRNDANQRRLQLATADRAAITTWPAHHDLVFCFRVSSHAVWRQLTQCLGLRTGRLVVDFDDIESIARRRAIPHVRHKLGRVKTIQELLDIRHTRRLEDRILRQADEVLVCSAQDKQTLLARHAKGAGVRVLPNTVELVDKPVLSPPEQSACHELLFLGAMNYPPNADGACHLVEDILPRLPAEFAGAVHLSVVGFKPSSRVQALAASGRVTVTGGVADTRPYYQRARMALVPLRFGGGTRIKILEAMALGRPVVATSLGAEGLDVVDGEHILLADSPETFARAIVRLLSDPELAAQLARNGRALVERHYSRMTAHRVLGEVLAAASRSS